MKTKKQNFVDFFAQDKLTRKQSATIIGGWDTNGKPPATAPGNGSGTGDDNDPNYPPNQTPLVFI
jgi:hypothetical protein